MLTAKEVRESTFSRSARGYRVDEIDEYLENVADTIEKLTEENRSLVKKIEILAAKVQEYREDEDSIRAALVTAQRSADSIIKEANSSVEGQLAQAKQDADAITQNAQNEADSVIAKANAEAEAALSQARLKAETLVEETKKKAASVLLEAKTKADSMISDAREGSRAETEKFELMKKKALEFRSALLQLYKEQFEIIKDGKFIREKTDESLKADEAVNCAEEETAVPFDRPADGKPEREEAQSEKQTTEQKTEQSDEPLKENFADIDDRKAAEENTEHPADKVDEPTASRITRPEAQTVTDKADKADETAENASSSEQGNADGESGRKGEEQSISDGFKISAASAENKFSDLKFGDDYDISKDNDDDDDSGKKVGFFRRKEK